MAVNNDYRSWLGWSRSGRRTSATSTPRSTLRLRLEELEDRALPSNFFAATVLQLIHDINAANNAGGTNTITLTAPTTSPSGNCARARSAGRRLCRRSRRP